MRHSILYIWLIMLAMIILFSSCMKKNLEYAKTDIVVEVQKNDSMESLARQYLHDPKNAWMISELNKKNTVKPGDKVIIPITRMNKWAVNAEGYQVVTVLCYERFETDTKLKKSGETPFLEQHLEFLKKNNYQVISLTRLLDFVDTSTQIPEKSVVITIDDNSLDVTDWVVPLLEKYSCPATVFVDIRNIGKKGFVSYQQLKNISSHGIEIASKSGWTIDSDIEGKPLSLKDYFFQIEKELTASKTTLERETGGKCLFYALPPSGGNNLLINVLKKKGYKAALSMSGEQGTFFSDSFNLGRVCIPESCPKKDFESKLITFRKMDLN